MTDAELMFADDIDDGRSLRLRSGADVRLVDCGDYLTLVTSRPVSEMTPAEAAKLAKMLSAIASPDRPR